VSLRPLPPIATRVDACAEQLRAAIVDGSFSVGERLPSERELSAHFGVTRPTLRGALARLAARGLVVAHQGRGTTVCDFQETGGPDLIGEILGQSAIRTDIIRDLLAVRRALAAVVLERIAEVRPDPACVAEAVAQFSKHASQGADPAVLAAADMAILRALIATTGSPVLRLCLNPILRVLQGAPGLRSALYQRPEDNVLGWQLLVGWLADPSPASIPDLVAALTERDAATLAWMAG